MLRHAALAALAAVQSAHALSATAASGRAIEVVSLPAAGGLVFTDRSYVFNSGSSPADIYPSTCEYIKAANNDKDTSGSSVQWTLTLTTASTVYLDFWGGETHHTNYGFALWKSGWSESSMAGTSFHGWGPGAVFKSYHQAGSLSLYGNDGNGHGTYYAIVCPGVVATPAPGPPAPPEVVTATAASGRSIEVVDLPSTGGAPFTDRSYTFNSGYVPTDFYSSNCKYVRAANDDKNTAAETVQWTLTTSAESVIYLDFWGGDSAHTTLGFDQWRSGWSVSTKSGTAFSAWGPGIVYESTHPAGTISLYGNDGNGHGTYYVIVCPVPTAAPVTTAPTTLAPITASPTTASPTTASPTTASPTTASPTTASPTNEALWDPVCYEGVCDHTRCGENCAYTVADQQACQAIAKAAGNDHYEFDSTRGCCQTTNGCTALRSASVGDATSNPWYLFKQPAAARVCQTSGTAGVGAGVNCVFPFTYSGVTYTECTTASHSTLWCATQVSSAGAYVGGQWGDCDNECVTTAVTAAPVTASPTTASPTQRPCATKAIDHTTSRGCIKLPTVTNARAVTLWFAPVNDGGYHWEYILDARSGAGNSWFSYLSFPGISAGSLWSKRVVNGVQSSSSSASLSETSSATATTGPWTHLYLEASSSFTDDVHVFCRYHDNGYGDEELSGKFGLVTFWNDVLTADEISDHYAGGKGPSAKEVVSYDAEQAMAYDAAATASQLVDLTSSAPCMSHPSMQGMAAAAASGVSGDPFTTDAQGNKVQFFLPLSQEQLLLKCGAMQLYGRAFASGIAGDHQQWFEDFRVTFRGAEVLNVEVSKKDKLLVPITDPSHHDIDITRANGTTATQKKQKEALTTVAVSVMKNRMTQTGIVAYNGVELEVSRNEAKRIGAGYSETVDMTVGSTRMQFTSAAAAKFASKTQQALYRHLDLKFTALDTKTCTSGILAQIWGVAKMTPQTAAMLKPAA